MSDADRPALDTSLEEVTQLREALAAAQRQIEVLSTFTALSETAATTSDLTLLAQRAEEVLRRNIPDLLAAYYERRGDRWVAQVTTEGLPPALLDLIHVGLPLDTPCFAQTVDARTPQFFEHWDAVTQRVPFTEGFHAVGLAPFYRDGQAVAILTVGLVNTEVWAAQPQQLFLAVYQALDSAHRRKGLVQIQERQRALEAFMTLTETIGAETEPLRLAERACELFLTLMPGWVTGYYEWDGELWCARLSDVPDPILRAALFAGVPASAPSLHAAVQVRGPVFFDHWSARDKIIARSESYGVAAFVPYFRDAQPVAMFAIASQHHQEWRSEERAVFRAVGRSLALGLERAWQAQALESRTHELQRSNRELKAANGELEAFAYSASHDLRTPVRHVKGFVEMDRRALNRGEPDKAERALQVVEGAADQMSAMIDAMLSLSRSTRQPLTHTAVNLGRLVERARQNVEDEFTGRQIEWRVAPLPEVTGDAATLQQVIVNLLNNAVKFTRPREQAVIEIGAQAGDEEWTVWVRDNGVGFDPAYTGKLFGPFQRLHLHSEFEGTGIGLATVRRIILRHGGRTWAEGVPGEGATFSFTLPHVRPLEPGGS
ncbi:sensor histidine kinase [Deinococcus humi]|uniref:histidine kinase n=1 Tax=Deinococcus humi TaxID=662880 RepID=A0A7W8JZG1_9DEIO|nr:ATP-binding protein [Deinococcus humi]MBB5365830.1 signal transduction histidine kinase [Deinococcus humi]GGO39389.1 hypothetical protein GCM10008949_47430 [Deinococcus humi]